MPYSAEIVGLPALLGDFAAIPGELDAILELSATDAINLLRINLATYPAPRSYPRTGNLASGWHDAEQLWVSHSFAFDASITNYTEYGPYVQGPGSQAPIHQGYWRTTQDVLTAQEPYAIVMFAAALIQLVDKLGGGK
ncbi:MAG: hypothetical protein IPO81_09565 [Kouleothrix sp.]|nr:hypothetical protein [Kouleothrix sp.]